MTYRYLKLLRWTIPLFCRAEHAVLDWQGVVVHQLWSRTWRGLWNGAFLAIWYVNPRDEGTAVRAKVTHTDVKHLLEHPFDTHAVTLYGGPIAYTSFSEWRPIEPHQNAPMGNGLVDGVLAAQEVNACRAILDSFPPPS